MLTGLAGGALWALDTVILGMALALPVFTGEAGGEKALDDLSWVMSRDGVLQIHGDGFQRK